MKQIYLLVFYLIIQKSIAQTLTVSYISQENMKYDICNSILKNDLILQNEHSLYFTTNPDTSQFKYKHRITKIEKIKSGLLISIGDDNYTKITEELFYKNYLKDSIIYNQNTGLVLQKKIIGERLSPIMSWKIITGKDSVILGYNCQKATTKFRGRDYIAYFSSKLAPRGGPWKFDGLPGLILYVISKDKYFEIKPYQIVLNQQEPPILNPYQVNKPEQIISWADYKIVNKIFYEKLLKKAYEGLKIGEMYGIESEQIEDMELGNMTVKK